MQQYKKILGKVMMTADGTYDSNKEYDPISLITDEETGKSYISRKEVPAGTQINNREYWQPVASSGIIDNGVIILNRKNSDGQVPIYDLKSATEAVAVNDRKGGVILGFLGFNPEVDTVPTWKLYQYNDVSPSNWTNIDYWLPMDYTNKYAGWFDNEEALYDSVPFPKVGMYAYVGNSATSAIIYRCYVDRTWQATEDKAFGGVVNLADEEDITSRQNKLKFKDKEYNPAQFSGLGKIYLRKNIVDGVNILTQSMMQATNTIYVIQYDYDLQGETITIPENCTLQFEGGSLSNGTVIGSNTAIKAELVKIFGLDINFSGNWNIVETYSEWFGAKGDGINDDTLAIQKCIDFLNIKGGVLKFLQKTYLTKGNHEIDPNDGTVVIKGISTIGSSTIIRHTGEGIIFWYNRNKSHGLLRGGGFDGLYIIGNSNTISAIRLSDRWGLYVKHCYIIDVTTSSAINVYNNKSWTEGSVIEDVQVRNSKHGIIYSRSDDENATSSCYNSIIRNFSMSKTIDNDSVISINNVSCYEANWDGITYWDESGGGHNGIYMRNGAILTGKVYIKSDGDAGQDTFNDLIMVNVGDGCRLDVEGCATMNQGNLLYSNLNSNKFARIIKQQTAWRNINNIYPLARFKGANIQAGGTIDEIISAGTIVYHSQQIPPYSKYKIELRTNENYSEYLLYTSSTNYNPTIHKISGRAEQLKPYPINQGTEGAYSANNGIYFGIYATGNFNGLWHLTITQL